MSGTYLNEILRLVAEANPTRNFTSLTRRLGKAGEEYGEVWEAFLNITSASNAKEKTPDDLMEELTDLFIVVVDCLLTPIPGLEMTETEREVMIFRILATKLAKWKAGQALQQAATQTIDDAV